MTPTYIAIDLKSFYASVECVDRQLDPLTANLVVADRSRTDKTICLAVSPALKALGIPGRARLFEVIQKVELVNAGRRRCAPGRQFTGKSCDAVALRQNPALELDFVAAVPRMARYMEISSAIIGIYLRYVAPEDIHVYSIDEVFINAAKYLKLYKLSPREFTMKLIREVLRETGITATAGIGSNLYLCKIAMDIEAKHIPPDENGVRIAELDELSYRRKLWNHRPLTDFWRVGPGIASRLESLGIHTMGEIARLSVQNEEIFYRAFGVNAQLLIDHAWGWEPVTIADIKAYKPENNSLSSGQVLQEPYEFAKARLVTLEMADALALELVEKHLVANQLILSIGYDVDNLAEPQRHYSGPVKTDHYGRTVPKEARGSVNLKRYTSSSELITGGFQELFDRCVNRNLLIRRITLAAEHVIGENDVPQTTSAEQPDLFGEYEKFRQQAAAEDAELEKEKRLQQAVLDIKKKLGKNAVLRGISLLEGATAKQRNEQVGGHRK